MSHHSQGESQQSSKSFVLYAKWDIKQCVDIAISVYLGGEKSHKRSGKIVHELNNNKRQLRSLFQEAWQRLQTGPQVELLGCGEGRPCSLEPRLEGARASPEGGLAALPCAVKGSVDAGRRRTKAGQLCPIHPHPTSHSNVCSMPGKKPEAF